LFLLFDCLQLVSIFFTCNYHGFVGRHVINSFYIEHDIDHVNLVLSVSFSSNRDTNIKHKCYKYNIEVHVYIQCNVCVIQKIKNRPFSGEVFSYNLS